MKNVYTIEGNGKMILVHEMDNRCVFLTEGNEVINIQFIWNDERHNWTARLLDKNVLENEDDNLIEQENCIYTIERDDGEMILVQEMENLCVFLTEDNEIFETEIMF